ncbi:MAG: alpha/beta hydrolase [Verrucomicrobiota bacterium JB023]|nr:alpha/beta hydrolase [Verrucomicrobiota bacterium JB023]
MSLTHLKTAPAIGEARDRELLKGAKSYVYYESPQGPLAAHFFLPPNHNPEGAQQTCILFLHGGQWDTSMPTQFVPHCHHFASRGAVAVTVEYRVFGKHRTNPLEAIEDARMAIGFLKQNAATIGIDAERIVVIGAGSGAHLALASAVLPDPPVTADGHSLTPSVVAGLSSIVDTSPKGVGAERFPNPKEAKKMSPLANLPRKNLPPCLLLHGTQDRIASFELITKFAKAYRRKGNKCTLVDYENAGHTFFNYNTNDQLYELTLRTLDNFLVELGFLAGDDVFPV